MMDSFCMQPSFCIPTNHKISFIFIALFYPILNRKIAMFIYTTALGVFHTWKLKGSKSEIGKQLNQRRAASRAVSSNGKNKKIAQHIFKLKLTSLDGLDLIESESQKKLYGVGAVIRALQCVVWHIFCDTRYKYTTSLYLLTVIVLQLSEIATWNWTWRRHKGNPHLRVLPYTKRSRASQISN